MIQVTTGGAHQLDSERTAREVATGRTISDSAAATIAAWWQSPGRVGSVLASLASGRTVDCDDLMADISATRREADDRCPLDYADASALNALAAWAMVKAYA